MLPFKLGRFALYFGLAFYKKFLKQDKKSVYSERSGTNNMFQQHANVISEYKIMIRVTV